MYLALPINYILFFMKIAKVKIESASLIIAFLSLLLLCIQSCSIKNEIEYTNFTTALRYYDSLVEKRQKSARAVSGRLSHHRFEPLGKQAGRSRADAENSCLPRGC